MQRQVDGRRLVPAAVIVSLMILGLLRGLVLILQREDVGRTTRTTVAQETLIAGVKGDRSQTQSAQLPPAISSRVDPDIKPTVSSKRRPSPAATPRVSENESVPEDPITEVVTRLNVVYDHEASDPAWAGKAQTSISQYFASAIEGPADVTASCKKTLCRITLQFADDRGRDAAATAFALPWDGEGVFQTDPNNPLKVVMYAAREGYPLPGEDAERTTTRRRHQ